ncbi:hypothetical protein ACFQJD_03745 [Haloplanus sp. GCM10025708]|uniref:DUF7285 family protein n=1 Tax=Haloferacaceae TaxID=1644056 RepID=UPI00360C9844
MSRSSARRAQVEPTAALAAVLVVCAGVGLYADVLHGAMPESDREIAPPTLARVYDTVAPDGVVAPSRLADGHDAGPAGYRRNLSVRAGGEQWGVGPTPPPTAEGASRLVSVRLGPARVVPGRLRVEVWS